MKLAFCDLTPEVGLEDVLTVSVPSRRISAVGTIYYIRDSIVLVPVRTTAKERYPYLAVALSCPNRMAEMSFLF